VKILIHTDTPNAPTGYGMQCALLALRLQADGHEVAVSAKWGHQAEIGSWRGIRLYPTGWLEQSSDSWTDWALHWFGGDPRGGWIITLLDVWGLKSPLLAEFNVLAWTPVDHDPVPTPVTDWLRRPGPRPVAMSRFGERELTAVGASPDYVPLAVETAVFKPTPVLEVDGQQVDARTFFRLPHDAFVVGMVAMNKDPQDRKGFNEAIRGFAAFHRNHPDAVLFLHTEPLGLMGGIDLTEVLRLAGVPEAAVVMTDRIAYRVGFSRQMMAAAYTAMDVLLAPSRGEGFCVPLIEAQACGTPVIVSDFTAQPELVGAGWLVDGQREYDPPHHSDYYRAFTSSVTDRLADAYGADLAGLQAQAIAFTQSYDADLVYDTFWRPLLAELEPEPVIKPRMEQVDVIVPFCREHNYARLMNSLDRSADGDVSLVIGERGTVPTRTYAENVNAAYADTAADWVLIVGDDCTFTEGWIDAIRELSDRYDVIGTNDSEPGRTRNPDVAAGRHADHFAIRRTYIETEGSSLDGPGVVMPTAYHHWFTDKEVIGLARARGVYGHAHGARIIHHHPGYDGDEAAREADPVYMAAVEHAEADRKTFMSRAPLIENHRVTR
jgi:glycosyltransferase involved in cell wall biosynthesis